MQDEITNQIASMIRSVTRNPDLAISEDTDLDSLGMESLDLVELIFLIEDKFGIDVPYNANASEAQSQFATVASVADAVRNLTSGKRVTV